MENKKWYLVDSETKKIEIVKMVTMFIIGLLLCMTMVGIPLGIMLMIPLPFHWSKAERRGRSEARMNFEHNAIESIHES